MLPTGKYAMFLRKSREDAEAERYGHFETLARHEAELTRLADRHGLHIDQSDVYREIVSGDSLEERTECKRMLKMVRQGLYAGVLVVDIQRLTRGDLIDQGTIINTIFR